MICTPYKYYYCDNVKRNKMGGTRGTYGIQKRCIQGLVGTVEGKKPLGRPRKDNIKMYFQEVGRGFCTWLIYVRTGTGRQLL
jgi:hypothetical protein